MVESVNRKELQRRLDKSRRLAAESSDPLTKARLNELVRDLEEQLGRPELHLNSTAKGNFP
jgi:hypothetical protein